MNEPIFVLTDPCPSCGGSGKRVRPNPAWLRWVRTEAHITLRAWARQLKLSAPYISDIERGHRACTGAILRHYSWLSEQALPKIRKAR